MAAVEVDSLTITYGDVTAVDDLSFRAEAGEVTCILGPNGAGKTSTVEALEGLRTPAAGRLSVIGLDPRSDHRALSERMGVMLQEGGIHPAVRVGEALRHAAALYPRSLDPAGLLDRLGLAGLERRTARRLSGGEQRRLALALALVGRPQVAFLDEPTSGVDPAGRQVIRQVIADLRGEGVTVLLTTHDLDEAERIADRVVIIVGGRSVAQGAVAELTRSGPDDQHVRFRAPAGLDRPSLSRHLAGAEVAETAPGDYTVSLPPSPQTVAAITAWLADHDLPLADLRAGRQRLEDVYLRLTAGDRPVADTACDRDAGPEARPSGDDHRGDTTEPGATGRGTDHRPGDATEHGTDDRPGAEALAGTDEHPGNESSGTGALPGAHASPGGDGHPGGGGRRGGDRGDRPAGSLPDGPAAPGATEGDPR